MRTQLLRRLVFFLSVVLAAIPTLGIAAFTPREIAQGFSDTAVIAKPRAEHVATAEAAELSEGMSVRHSFPQLGHIRVLQVRSGERAAEAVHRLRATGRYEYVEPDRIVHSRLTPNDPYFTGGQQWSLRNTGQSGGTSGADIGAVTAWNTTTSAANVIVAVLDSGIFLSHVDLIPNLWSNGSGQHGISAVNSNGTTTDTNPNDSEVGHGTHVAGIIGAVGNNSTGVSGIAWTTQLMALRFLHGEDGQGSTSDAIACINYAITNGAKIMNASYGSDTYSQAEFDAFNSARSAGIIMVVAAGNDGVVTDNGADYPAGLALDNVVAVAATDRTDALASFSNYGAGSIDLGAPGVEIVSTYNTNSTSYATASGTSMAAPHVSGALALLRAQFPNDTYRQLINRLLRSTTKISSLTGKVQSGGRLNLAAAITSTDNRPFNDSFSERALLSGANVRVRANNIGATKETFEPAHAGAVGGASLWWSWTASDSSTVVFDTAGSSYDTLLAVYTGSAVNSLSSVGSNDNATGVTTSQLTINATAGTTYQIAIDGKNGATGFTALRIGVVPANDNFANAKVIAGESASVAATLLSATKETGEPKPTSLAAGNSIWYKWTAPNSAHYVLSVYTTQMDAAAAIYTGSAVGSLTTIASNNDSSSTNSDALVPFDATAGTTYYFQVDHVTGDGTSGGDFTMTLTQAAWEFPADDEATSSPAVASDGTIYFGVGSTDHHDTRVYAVTSAGALKWKVATGASGVIGAAPAIGSDGTVYIGSDNKIFYALNPSNGATKWTFTAGTALSSTAAIAGDGTIYFRDNATLYALTSGGSQKWTFALTGSTDGTYCSPVIGADGTIYVGTNGGKFYAINSSGTQKWSYTADDDIYTSPAIASDGTIYFATLNGTVYALTDSGGSATKKWSWTTTGNYSVTSSIALGTDGSLYFASYDHKLYALTSGGAQKWAFTLGDEVRASSPAIAADGTVYIGCYDGLIYAVNSSGAQQHTYATAKQIRSSPAIAGNRLYIGSADAKLYAIDIGQSAASSAWPMFHADVARDGRVGTTSVSITSQPQSRTVVIGSSVTLSVTATASGSITYQWYKDGNAIGGATSSTLTLTNVSSANSGSYTVTVTSAGNSVTSAAATISVVAAGSGLATFADIATRAYCSTGDNVTIGGFVVSGASPKRVLIRAVGPSLTAQGLSSSEILADPTVDVYHGSTVIASNNDWADSPNNSAEISSLATQLGAAPLLSSDTKSSAIILTLDPGVYTFIVRGRNESSGIVLLEVYDAEVGIGSKFVNIATRAKAATGNGVAIGGFVISGRGAKQVLIRALGGSTLANQGLSSASVLADPTIELHDAQHGNVIIASNDNWGSDPTIIATAARVGAAPIDTNDTKSAAILMTLQPGVYSFIASGVSNTSGIVLVEVYDAD